MKMTVADFVIDFFEKKGIDSTFLVSGGAIMFITDSLANSKKIKCICNHNEQASAMCADGYAKAKNDIALCIGTSGPGATNLITGIAGAWVDSSPVFAITGQSKLEHTLQGSNNLEIRQYGLQELNIVGIVKAITKYAVMVSDPKSIKYHLEKAYFKATTGRKGPVWIDLPVDIQGAVIETAELQSYEVDTEKAKNSSINQVLKLLAASKRPLIIAGNGIKLSASQSSFTKLIKQYNFPVVTTPLAADLIPYDDGNYIGHPGIKGDRAGNFVVENADLIISIGSSLHVSIIGYDEKNFARNIKKIVIDVDKNLLKKHKFEIDIKVNEDTHDFIAKLLKSKVKLNMDSGWLEYARDLKKQYPVINESHRTEKNKVNYYQIIDTLNKAIKQHKKNTIISYDSGSAFYIVGQALKVISKQKVIAPGGFGGMGYALPAAMGAFFAQPEKTPICIVGDGSFQMNVQELEAITENNIPIKIIIINNNGYVSIRNTQDRFFNKRIAEGPETGVTNPDFGKLAKVYNIPYIKMGKDNFSATNLLEMLDQDGSIICEILSNEEQELLPVNSSKKNSDGKIVSAPLEDMYPFQNRDEFNENMRYAINRKE